MAAIIGPKTSVCCMTPQNSEGLNVRAIHGLYCSDNSVLLCELKRLILVGQAECMERQGLRSSDWEILGRRVFGIAVHGWENSL
jgi:hypothetical protein